MILHLLSGPEAVFSPERPMAGELATWIGPEMSPAPLDWLLPGEPPPYHDALIEDAASTKIDSFLLSLHAGFGGACSPLVVLPGLLGSPAPSAVFALARRLASCGLIETIHLRAVAAPQAGFPTTWQSIDEVGRLLETTAKRLRNSASSATVVESRLDVIDPVAPQSAALWRNLMARELTARAEPRLEDMSLRSDNDLLMASVSAVLREWSETGLSIPPQTPSDRLDAVARDVIDILLGRMRRWSQ